jgi:integrase
MSGHIVERGPNRWGIVLEIYVDGRRKQRWSTFRGTKREAQKRLAELITEREHGSYIEPSKQTVAHYFEGWLRDWAPMRAGPKSLERYGQLAKHVTAAFGAKPMQHVTGGDLNALYRSLAGKLSPRSVKHVHVLIRRVFGHAFKNGDLKVDPSTKIDAPKAPHVEAPVLRSKEIPIMLAGLRGVLRPIGIVALGTGMRRGELCALRWADVDLEKSVLEVKQSLEETKGGLRFKPPKSARGRRTISLSSNVAACLQQHRKDQLELRFRLGMGRLPADALVFATYDGRPRSPDCLTDQFGDRMKAIGLPHVTLHTLRHTHASILIREGIDILTISRRLGHSSAAITLGIYGHLVSSQDRAADVIDGFIQVS